MEEKRKWSALNGRPVKKRGRISSNKNVQHLFTFAVIKNLVEVICGETDAVSARITYINYLTRFVILRRMNNKKEKKSTTGYARVVRVISFAVMFIESHYRELIVVQKLYA